MSGDGRRLPDGDSFRSDDTPLPPAPPVAHNRPSREQGMTTPDRIRIEYVALADLKRHPRNPKEHDLGALHTSVNRFGYVAPVLIDERTGYLVAGHGRLDALAQMQAEGKQPPARIEARGDEWYVPVIRGVAFNSDSEVEAYLVADNRLTMLGGWNEPELAALLQDLANEDEELLRATGYDADDLAALLHDLAPTALDGSPVDIPEQFMVLVECSGEYAQAELLERLNDEGYKCRALIS